MMRSFRVDRVSSVEVLDDAAPKPDGFDLMATWETIVGHVEDLRRPIRAEMRTSRSIAELLHKQHGTDVEIGPELPDGRVEAYMFAGHPQWIAERLAGWGRLIEVVAPPEVRMELARLARELLDMHADAQSDGSTNSTRI